MIFLKYADNITRINQYIIPILIIFIIVIGLNNLYNIKFSKIGANIEVDNSLIWIYQALIYSSYNLILVIPVLVNFRTIIRNKKYIVGNSIMVGIIIGVLTIFIYGFLININENLANIEMPMVYVISKKYRALRTIYGIVILMAIFTTANSTGISFLNNINEKRKNLKNDAIVLSLFSVIISGVGFSKLIEILFPLFGLLGLIQMYLILKFKI